ncbi:MAG: NYN domain-containing protein [Verrucomicrobiales bacterium]|nr:NYN domain-containing protein [Verrucomicrobiales bacterium]
MVPSFLLVDGNNIIHAWPDLLDLHRRQSGLAHEELIRRLTGYRDLTGDRVVVVFDGRGARISNEKQEPGLQVMYSSSGKTADDVIERLATKYADKYDITVATDDRAEQDIVISVGGYAISSDTLRDKIERAESEMIRFLEQRRKR